ncbi:PucR family transcriptional regulator ligand-binding domain-containing protein [Streptomyces sp. TRM68367]|uniref:helix-turn-helix domain-containing protein n=1 Tax=Streptomyces sp. TRM68367 TaxID=2758415 RepID=UPI00165A491D|nr:PucR family transcriptional regulator [Streptomyces sp. TRM68367]MBC9731056.1 PucR family transcriptional regulator ligand-binding domain-containing protein [Streptomyces sp. TRM68367]
MPLTLAGLLAHQDLGLKLRTGRGEVVVRWAHVSELVDPTPYLDRDSLLLTTGLSLGRTSRRWPEYVERLVRAGVPALGFGVGLRHTEVPQALLTEAVRRGLSVVEVPKPTPFSAVVRRVVDGLVAVECAEQTAAVEHYRGLVRAAMTPPPHRSVITRLAGQLDAWVLLLSREGHLLAGAPEYARRHAERVRLEVARTRSWHAAAFDHAGARVTLLPVGRAARPAGVLAVGRSAPLRGYERGVVDVAVDLLSLGVAQAAELLDSERRERATVLSMLLLGRVDAAGHAAEALGIPLPEPPVRVAALTVSSARRDDLLEALENERSLQIVSALVAGDSRGRVVVVLPVVEGDAGVVQSVISAVSGSLGVIGEPVDMGGLARVWPRIAALADTLPASAAGRLLSTQDVASVGLLSYLGPAEAEGWAFSLLAPLESEGARRIDLMETVRTFLAHNGNTEAASAALGIHRRTLTYRLGRAEMLLGRQFSDPGLRAELWLALAVRGQ